MFANQFRSLDFLGFPKYEVGDDGSVWSFQTKSRRRLKAVSHNGYLRVILNHHKDRWTVSVHTLVLLSFVGRCPDGMECRHGNGDRGDNRLENLSWGTRMENASDRIRHGTSPRGPRQHLNKLSEVEVRAIRAGFAAGESKAYLARRYHVSHSNICSIIKRQSWKYL